MKRIVLLAQDTELTRIFYDRLSREIDIAEVLIERRVSRWSLLKRRAQRLGLFIVAGQVAFQLLAQRPLRALSRRRVREILREAGAEAKPLPASKTRNVDSFNSESGHAAITVAQPDVIIVHGARILSARTIRAAGVPLLNVHAGVTPLYRGVHGGYWALAEADPGNCGVTVHRVDAGIDTGEPLGQALVRPTSRDNFATYPVLQVLAGAELLARVLQGRQPPPSVPTDGSRLRHHPTLWRYLATGFAQGVW